MSRIKPRALEKAINKLSKKLGIDEGSEEHQKIASKLQAINDTATENGKKSTKVRPEQTNGPTRQTLPNSRWQ